MANDTTDWRYPLNRNGSEFQHVDDSLDPFEYYPIHLRSLGVAMKVIFPFIILGGIFVNILGLVIVARGRMWLRHEGYVYMAAIFSTDISILIFNTGEYCFTLSHSRYNPVNANDFFCKVWHFFMTVFFSSGWLAVALIFDVYLREHRVHRRRCGCPIFAAKFCTLFVSRIVVGIIYGVVFSLGVSYLVTFRIKTYTYGQYVVSWCEPSSSLVVPLIMQSILMWVLPFIFFLPVILILTLCISREGGQFGFSQIEDRSIFHDQFRTAAITVSSMIFFSQFCVVATRYVFEFLFIIGLVVQIVYGLSLMMAPIFCLIMITQFRESFLSMLREIPFCRRCVREGQDEGTVRLQNAESERELTTPEPEDEGP